MTIFTPATRIPTDDNETRQQTSYGSVYGRYWSMPEGHYLAFVDFQLGPHISIHRGSHWRPRMDADAARAWVEAAIAEGPWFVLAALPAHAEAIDAE